MNGNSMQVIIVIWPLIAAFISYYIGRFNKTVRDYFVVLATLFEFIGVLMLFPMASNSNPALWTWDYVAGFSLSFKFDGFRSIYAIITSFMWLMTALFSSEYFKNDLNRNRYHFFNLVSLGATMGIMTSADLMTSFIFFELMSFASYALVAHDETERALKAANSFLMVGFIGGLSILAALFMVSHYLGTLQFDLLVEAVANYSGSQTVIYAIGVLLLIGFGGKAGLYPLHFWLPKAHPVAPAPGSALLSGILTKAGIFGVLVISSYLLLHDWQWGFFLLIMGTITMFIGAFLALFSIDLKRTLALSSVSQIGFIVFGIGMQGILGSHNALAVRGTFLHMINHSLIKLVLFMAAGLIYIRLHRLDLNTIRGYGRNKFLLKLVFAIASLSLMGIPLFSAYVSKTLLHESLVEQIWTFSQYNFMTYLFQFIEAIFMLSGGFTVAYMTKLFVAIFVEKHPYEQEDHHKDDYRYASFTSSLALGIPAAIILSLGLFPSLMDNLADFGQSFMFGQAPAHTVHYFAIVNLKGALISILIGLVVYFSFIRNFLMAADENGHLLYLDRWPEVFDIERVLYQPLFTVILPALLSALASVISVLPTWLYQEGIELYHTIYQGLYKPMSPRYKDSFEKRTFANREKILTSHMEFGLMQYLLGAVVALLVIYFVNR